jgi:uncharacterized membrane protein YeaQ/YmgE (transglycosylase-associated protein family)
VRAPGGRQAEGDGGGGADLYQAGACTNSTNLTGVNWRYVGLIVYLIILFFVGLFVGALARLLLPGPDPMGIGMTALVGICGTFSAGLFSWYVLHRHGAGLLLSVVFSMLVVWIYRHSRGGSHGRRRGFGGRGRPL